MLSCSACISASSATDPDAFEGPEGRGSPRALVVCNTFVCSSTAVVIVAIQSCSSLLEVHSDGANIIVAETSVSTVAEGGNGGAAIGPLARVDNCGKGKGDEAQGCEGELHYEDGR